MVTEGIRTFAAYAGSPAGNERFLFDCTTVLLSHYFKPLICSAVREQTRSEQTRSLTNEELQELSELNMFDESNLCHLEVRDPNPPEVIAEKFETKAQAVLDSISTQGSPPIEKQKPSVARPQVQPMTGKTNVQESLTAKATSFAAAASEKARSSTTNVGMKVIPTVRPTRTKLKETVSLFLFFFYTFFF